MFLHLLQAATRGDEQRGGRVPEVEGDPSDLARALCVSMPYCARGGGSSPTEGFSSTPKEGDFMRKRYVAAVVAAIAVVSLGPAAVGALSRGSNGGVPNGVRGAARPSPAVVTGTCKTGKTNYAASSLQNSATTSTSYVDIPEATVSFTQGGTSPSCVIVVYSAMVFAPSSELMFVRPILDGSNATPGETQFSGDDDENGNSQWARSHAMNFVFPSVSPGAHTIVMQFHTLFGHSVYTHQHTTLVEHR